MLTAIKRIQMETLILVVIIVAVVVVTILGNVVGMFVRLVPVTAMDTKDRIEMWHIFLVKSYLPIDLGVVTDGMKA